jgi:hypothetical protein
MTELTLRMAGPEDSSALERLAQTDDRRLPPPPHLIACCDGVLAAAVSLVTGELVADPFRRTSEIADVLLCHAAAPRVSPFTQINPRTEPLPADADSPTVCAQA